MNNLTLILCGILAVLHWLLTLAHQASNQYNGSRLIPSFLLSEGVNFARFDGPLLSWMYGPMTAIGYLPATLFPGPTLSPLVGVILSNLFYLVPAALLFFGNVKTRAERKSAILSFITFALFTMALPSLSASAFLVHADAPALAALTLSLYFLLTRPRSGKWLSVAALLSVVALFAKQTFLPAPFAIAAYLWVNENRRQSFRFFGAFVVFFLVAGGIFSLAFGFTNLFQTMVLYPGAFPWNSSYSSIDAPKIPPGEWAIASRFKILVRAFLEFLEIAGVPLLVVGTAVALKLKNSRVYWRLPFWVALFLLPISLLGRVKAGGGVNTLSPALYYLVLSALLVLQAESRSHSALSAFRWVLLVYLTVLQAPRIYEPLLLVKNSPTNPHVQAVRYSKMHPEEVYFPYLPLATYLSEGRVYHYILGIAERHSVDMDAGPEQMRAYLPARMSRVVMLGTEHACPHVQFPELSKKVSDPELPGWTVCLRN